MSLSFQRRVVLFVVLLSVVLLVVPHAGGHGVVLAWVMFAPLFLFGLVGGKETAEGFLFVDECFGLWAVARPSLFQLPPPSCA
jgi:hypothetical protein